MTLIISVIIIALIFEYINGFHDTANSIATVVSTKVLSPRQAIVLAATTNLIGALWGTAVAKTISSGLVDMKAVSSEILICTLFGAIVWNLITWWFGLPSSSSHALVGGLCGAALAAAHNNWNIIIWSVPSPNHWWEGKGLLWKVVIPMVISPLIGFCLAFGIMAIMYILLQRVRPQLVNNIFGKLQMVSAAGMGFMHGTNDAQKTMGIIALALVSAGNAGTFENIPDWLSWLKLPPPEAGKSVEIVAWIKIVCAITMAAGTAAGGWRIIKTLGHKMVKLQPIHGFAAETSASTVIATATYFGIPVSTTHNISGAIMGVGAAKKLSAVKWPVAEQMLWAWILTIPMTALLAYGAVIAMRALGWIS